MEIAFRAKENEPISDWFQYLRDERITSRDRENFDAAPEKECVVVWPDKVWKGH
jgi:hypothetical protein